MANQAGSFAALPYYEMDPNACVCALAQEGVGMFPPSSITAQPAPASSELGVDFDVLDDMRSSFVLCGGYRNLGNAIARRLSTPSGALAAVGDDPDYGYDLRGLLGEDLTDSEIQALGARIQQEVMKDERVQAAEVNVTYSLANYSLAVEINLETATGPFRLVLGIGEASVDVIDEGLQQNDAT